MSASAKRAGVYKGRKPVLTPKQVEEIRSRLDGGESKTELARTFGVSRQTIYSALERASEPSR